MIRKITTRLAKTKYIRESLEAPTELKDIWKQPSTRTILGFSLIGLSYVIGWPAITALGILSVYLREPLIALIGGPVTYGISHLVFLFGAWLVGAEHAQLLLRYTTKLFFKKILRHGT